MFSENWHRRIFLFGLISLACGLLFGPVTSTIPQIILGANWFLEKNYIQKIKKLYTNKIFWLLCSIYFMHLLGLIYTSDLASGLEDIKTKVPLLIYAIIFFSTKRLTKKEFELVFIFFFLSVIISSIFCFAAYHGFTHETIIDVRKASIFMSHIRFSLIIAFTIFSIPYFFNSKINVIIGLFFMIWLLYFMLSLQMATGLMLLLIVGFILLMMWLLKKRNIYLNTTILLITTLLFYFLFKKTKTDLLMYNKNVANYHNILLKKTVNNRDYLQDTLFNLAENGTLIAININDFELQKEWLNRSKFKYTGIGNNGNEIRFTLLRYLASKGFTKDSIGINTLTGLDIINIENGISNFNYPFNSGLNQKWRELIWEYTKYKRNENPTGHTISMRLEFWKTALFIIKQHPYFGVGTGDIQQSFNEAYVQTNSKLSNQWRLRCHNQYLAITVAFGLVGLIVFLIYLFYPILTLHKKLHALYWPFILIILFSFLTEDTLESQAGINFFGIFNTIFIWLAYYPKEKEN